jgi:hypothetical protein
MRESEARPQRLKPMFNLRDLYGAAEAAPLQKKGENEFFRSG